MYANTPTLVKNGSLAVIDWTNSFVLNGRLREYILRADNILMTRGVKTAYGVQRTSKDGGEVHTLSVCVSSLSGNVSVLSVAGGVKIWCAKNI